ncbi:MAG: phage major capsid protein [Actinomycetia bacterium]|nr:phage major capsid protein [Actinomycetes bacterium]
MTDAVIKLRQDRAQLIERGRDMLDKAEAENRNLAATERQDFGAILAQADAISIKIEEAGEPPLHRSSDVPFSQLEAELSEVREEAIKPSAGYTPEGDGLRLLEPHESASKVMESRSDITWGSYLRDRVTRGVDTTDASALVPVGLVAQLIDLSRAKSRVIEAGARRLIFDTKSTVIPKTLTDPVVRWKPELAAITPSDPTFGPLTLTAKTCAVLSYASVELLEDSEAGSAIADTLAASLALEMDRVCLLGSAAAGEPVGIINTADVQKIAGVGVVANYNDFSMAAQMIQEVNGQAGAVILNPALYGCLDRLTDGDHNPLSKPSSCEALKWLQTSQVPVDLTTFAVVGDFSKLVLGIRTSMRLETSREATGAFDTLGIAVRAYIRMDVAVTVPEHFTVLEDVVIEYVGS